MAYQVSNDVAHVAMVTQHVSATADPSARPLTAVEQTAPCQEHPAARTMPVLAWCFVLLILCAGLAISLVATLNASPGMADYAVFGFLLICAAAAQLYKADGPNHELFHPAPIFLFAGVLLLPLPLFILLVLIPHLLEWAKERWQRSPHLKAWYLQPFNIAMFMTAGFVTQRALALFGFGAGQGALPTSLVVAAAAILTYVVTNQIILGLVLRLARAIPWRDSQVLTKGLLTEVVLASLGFVLAHQWHQNPWLTVIGLAPLALIYQSLSIPRLQAENLDALQTINRQLSHANQEIQQLNDELFHTLANIFDARDPYVGGHAAQVAAYAVAIAQELGLVDDRVELIRQAAYMHDIGKMAIPESILHKPAKLTDEEFALIKTHAVVGAGFLETSQGLRHLAPFVRHHHERWDGRGYPDQLRANEIPLESRILNVCDSVEAMASDRPYHEGLSVDSIIVEVQRCAGSQFDPAIADIFIRIAEREGSRFVINSARAVQQKHGDAISQPIFSTGLVFAKVYHQSLPESQRKNLSVSP